MPLEFYSNYGGILNEILQTIIKIRNLFPANVLNSSISNRLTNQSLEYFQNYIQYCIYDTQQQQQALLLYNLQQQQHLNNYENKLLNANEKVYISNQIFVNITEMIKLVEGTKSSTLPTITSPDILTEESQEDLLRYSLRSLKSIFRNYKLIYLAECHAYYGLITSETQPENKEEILQKYLGNAFSLLEYSDELMTGDVYNYLDDYSSAVSSLESIKFSSIEKCRNYLTSLEKLISGGKTRIIAYHTISTLPKVNTGLIGLSKNENNNNNNNDSNNENNKLSANIQGNITTTTDLQTSLLRNPNKWISLSNSSLNTETNSTLNQKGKNIKGKVIQKNKQKKGINTINTSNSALIIQPIPPLFEPIACKPIFYDIALNYVESSINDSLDIRCGIRKEPIQKIQSNSGNETNTQTSSGIVGVATSWLGWFSGSK